MSNKYYIAGGAIVLFLIATTVWFFLFRSTGTLTTDTATPVVSFGEGSDTTTANNTPIDTGTVNGTQIINTTPVAQQKIFKITDGPIVGATLVQTLRPTTTLARYIRQDDGHVFDIPLGVAGAVPKVISNVTIPGGQRVLWLEGGNSAIMQYVDDASVVKTVYLGFPPATTTSTTILPTRLQFLPDNIEDIAVSPDGKSVTYLLKTANGADGYVAKSNGTNSKKMFSFQLSELLISWPSLGTIVVQTKPATGVTGMVFSVDSKTGNVSSLISAQGVSATADPAFKKIAYSIADSSHVSSYIHTVSTGLNELLAPTVIPEKCFWNTTVAAAAIAYCASPDSEQDSNYMDAWHKGFMSVGDDIWKIDFNAGKSTLVTIPGGKQGGVASDIIEMALSPDERYLSFTTKGARSLWGVTLVK